MARTSIPDEQPWMGSELLSKNCAKSSTYVAAHDGSPHDDPTRDASAPSYCDSSTLTSNGSQHSIA